MLTLSVYVCFTHKICGCWIVSIKWNSGKMKSMKMILLPDGSSFVSLRRVHGLKEKSLIPVLKIWWGWRLGLWCYALWCPPYMVTYLFSDLSMPQFPTTSQGLPWRLGEMTDVKFTVQVHAPGDHSRHVGSLCAQQVSPKLLSRPKGGGGHLD